MNQQENNIETPEETFERVANIISNANYENEYYELSYMEAREITHVICVAYHEERQRIEQQVPKKTLQECKDEVAKSTTQQYINWKEAIMCTDEFYQDKLHDQAAELYAQQFKHIEVTDEEIWKSDIDLNAYEGMSIMDIFVEGAKWMRDKQKNL